MAFTDLHEIEGMFSALVTLDTRGEALSYSQSAAEISEAKRFWQLSNKTKRNARERAARAEKAALNPKPPKPPKVILLCAEAGCLRDGDYCRGMCGVHYRAHRNATVPGVREAGLDYHKARSTDESQRQARREYSRKWVADKRAKEKLIAAQQRAAVPLTAEERELEAKRAYYRKRKRRQRARAGRAERRRLARAAYRLTERGQAARTAYRATAPAQRALTAYNSSDAGRAAAKRYNSSERGREVNRAARAQRKKACLLLGTSQD